MMYDVSELYDPGGVCPNGRCSVVGGWSKYTRCLHSALGSMISVLCADEISMPYEMMPLLWRGGSPLRGVCCVF